LRRCACARSRPKAVLLPMEFTSSQTTLHCCAVARPQTNPHGTQPAQYVLTSRDVHKWVHSVIAWGRMDRRISQCTMPEVDLPYTASAAPYSLDTALADEKWVAMLENFYEKVHLRARRILERAHEQYGVLWFEVDIESPDAGRIVAENIALRPHTNRPAAAFEKCWGHSNALEDRGKKDKSYIKAGVAVRRHTTFADTWGFIRYAKEWRWCWCCCCSCCRTTCRCSCSNTGDPADSRLLLGTRCREKARRTPSRPASRGA
jgi:hypothetical protein